MKNELKIITLVAARTLTVQERVRDLLTRDIQGAQQDGDVLRFLGVEHPLLLPERRHGGLPPGVPRRRGGHGVVHEERLDHVLVQPERDASTSRTVRRPPA